MLPNNNGHGWEGVDLDRTLAHYESDDYKTKGEFHIGSPIPNMQRFVRELLKQGKQVKIFTARLAESSDPERLVQLIQEWTLEHLGATLEVTNVKDRHMYILYDDRATGVEANTGRLREQVLQDRIEDLEEALHQSQWTLEFMHGCLVHPEHVKYAFPEQTEELLQELRSLAQPPELCIHASGNEPDCGPCQEMLRRAIARAGRISRKQTK